MIIKIVFDKSLAGKEYEEAGLVDGQAIYAEVKSVSESDSQKSYCLHDAIILKTSQRLMFSDILCLTTRPGKAPVLYIHSDYGNTRIPVRASSGIASLPEFPAGEYCA